MMKLYKIMFFNSMIMGTIIAISSQSWLSAWIGLEINLLSLMPLLKNNKNKYPSEAALKYFITQVMASSILLFSIIMFMLMNTNMKTSYNIIESTLTSTALLLKMGAAPLHFWFPEVLSGLNWNNSFILLTWQKIAPMMLLTYHMTNTMFFSFVIIVSSIISGIQGLNQICLRKILAYSSINHLSWMLSAMLNSLSICLTYFLIYSFINLNIILIFKNYNIFYFNQLTNIFTYKKMNKLIFMLNFLSLGGLPPFLGFYPKWITINNLINNNHFTISIMLIIFTLISMYFYMRISFSSFNMYAEESLVISFNKIKYLYFMLNIFTLSSLIICSMIYIMF